jgi:lysophospholipase L1-like esterase
MKRFLLLLVLLTAGWTAVAQVRYHRRIPPVPQARFDRNALQFPGGASADFDAFLRKLDTLVVTGHGDVRILHIGGSHVQGGTWTNTFRKNLMALRYGMDGGRGLVFPYAAAGTNTPLGYQTSYTGTWTSSRCLKPDTVMGLTGMTVSTSDTTATVSLDLLPEGRKLWDLRFTVRSADILGYGDLEPVIYAGRDTVRGWQEEEHWHFELPHYVDYLRIGFQGYPGQFTIKGIYLDNPANGLTISEVGVNGAMTSSFLNCEDFTRDLQRVKPDLVIFSIGINDLQGSDFDARRFISNYGKLVQLVRHANPHCAFLFTSCNDSWKGGRSNPFGARAEQAFREIAAGSGGALWDLYEIMGGSGSMEAWVNAKLARPDHIHFTPEGYTILGNLLFNALMDAYAATVR